jgi:hypothetical protein
METTVTEIKEKQKKNPLHFEWILPVIFQPRKTIEKITSQEKSVWLTPLLVVSVLIILAALVAGPIKRNIIQMGLNTPENFQYYTAEQQAQFQSAQANRTSPLFLYVFPAVTSLAGLWVSWFLLSSLMHLSLTLAGSRAQNVRSYNLAAWSLLPLGVRHLVQIVAMIATKTVVSNPGLSGFITGDLKGFTAFTAALLGVIDIYFIWQIILLLLGVCPLSSLKRSQAWAATGVSLVILMLLLSLPGFLSHALSGLTTSSSFFF